MIQVNSQNTFNSGSSASSPFGNSGADCPECFDEWMRKYGNRYGYNAQDQYRRNVFMDNYNRVQAHNRLPNVTYKMKVTQFTGLTKQEFQQYALGGQLQ